MPRSVRSIIVMGLVTATLSVSDALANCSSKWPSLWSMPINSSHIGKSLKEVLNQNGFFPTGGIRNLDNRLSFATTPDGTPGIKMDVRRGENRIVSFDTQPFKPPGIQKACVSVDVFFSSGFDWGTAGTKIGVGLWGGETHAKNSGGWAPQLQEGWSVRLVNSARGARAYAYHLNRDGELRSESRCNPYQCEYGETLGNYAKLDVGSWNNIQIEVQMNTVGSSNGTLRVWFNGNEVVSKSDLLWRKSSNWAIAGLKFTDMWGGNTANPKNFSPRSQEMYYRNFRIFGSGGDVNEGSSAPSSSNGGLSSAPPPSDSAPSKGQVFGAVFPLPKQTVTGVENISWTPHPNADRYRVRLVDKSSGTNKLLNRFSAEQAGCASGDLCEINYSGSELRDGRHRIIVHALRGRTRLKIYQFDFFVGNNGTRSPRTTSSTGAPASPPGSATSGTLRAIHPTAGQRVNSLSQISWHAHANADRYRVRLVDKTRKTDRLKKKYAAGSVGCATGGECRLDLDGVQLKDGRHRLIVYALRGNSRLRIYEFDFKVGAGT